MLLKLPKFLLSLIPAGLTVSHILQNPNRLTVIAQSRHCSADCPLCHHLSQQIHSHYLRRLADLPWSMGQVELHVRVRRFRCLNRNCRRQIFAEPLAEVAAPRQRGTVRLRAAQRQIGLALGGEPGARLARQLAMPVSADTLLRLIQSASMPPGVAPRVLGLDDWAWRRGQRYGTLLCDLERRRIIGLLPDRQADTVAAWLKAHPGVEIVARDRAGAYAEGIRRGAPGALQVADRWHLLCNLSEAVQGVLDRVQPVLQQAARQTQSLLFSAEVAVVATAARSSTRAEQRRADNQAARQARYTELAQRRAAGQSIRQIARELGLGYKTARRWWRAGHAPTGQRPSRPSELDPYRAYLQRRWQEGCHNAAQLWRELTNQGFAGCASSVRQWAGRRRQRASSPSPGATAARLPWTPPSSRRMVRLVLAEAGQLSDADGQFVSTLLAHSPELARVVDLARRFRGMVQQRQPDGLESWLAEAKATGLTMFAQSLSQDLAAVRAALTFPWSTSPVEGHINRLKTVKRQMYGRAGFALLRQRLLAA
ncbi:MAG TPA: ISL3 family transposase [Candidatus Competibacteraceae bacterium]|nr:ISL3 family transposase [Candidatus Competibacteraceae bacterium]